MPQVVSATNFRDNFADFANRVAYAGEEFVVEKQGRKIMKVVPVKVANKQAKKARKMTGLEFVNELANWHIKGLPSDLAKNHDKYAWE